MQRIDHHIANTSNIFASRYQLQSKNKEEKNEIDVLYPLLFMISINHGYLHLPPAVVCWIIFPVAQIVPYAIILLTNLDILIRIEESTYKIRENLVNLINVSDKMTDKIYVPPKATNQPQLSISWRLDDVWFRKETTTKIVQNSLNVLLTSGARNQYICSEWRHRTIYGGSEEFPLIQFSLFNSRLFQ